MTDSIKAKRVLVTGAAGFIGSNLCDYLLKNSASVVGIDNFSMGSKDNLKDAFNYPNFSLVEGDVRSAHDLRKCGADFDCIYHLAAFKIPRFGGAIHTLSVNVKGTQELLEFASQMHSHVVIASTSDVYGKNPNLPFSEVSDSVLGPSNVRRWSYAASKLIEEHLAFAYAEEHEMAVSIVRIFGSYGPRNHRSWWGGPQAVFIDAALNNTEIEIHGDGQQTRSFCYITDLVRGLALLGFYQGQKGEIVNLGNNQEVTIEALGKMIWEKVNLIQKTNNNLRLKYTPYSSFGRYEDVRRRVPDLSKARQLLGYEALVSLERGIEETIKWHLATST